MSLIYSTSFDNEGALSEIFDNQVGTTVAFDATHVKDGSRSILFHQTGSASASKKNLASGTRNIVIRTWIWLAANPTAIWQLYLITQSGGVNPVMRISTSGQMQAGFAGGGFQSSSAISLGAWHSIDARIDVNNPTFTFDWQVDNLPQTQASFAGQTPGDLSNIAFGNSGATNLDCWVDAFQISSSASDYPQQDITTTYTVTFPALSPAPQIVVPVVVGTPRTKERAIALARKYLHTLADQTLAASAISGSAPSCTITFPALGQAPQTAVPVTASAASRAFAIARKAVHSSAEQSAPTVA